MAIQKNIRGYAHKDGKLIKTLYTPDHVLPGRDERVPEIPNLAEDRGIELEPMNVDTREVVMGHPYFNEKVKYGTEGDAEGRIIQEAIEKLDKNVAFSFNLNERKTALLVIVDELIAYYVEQKDYNEISRLAIFAAGIVLSDRREAIVNAEPELVKNQEATKNDGTAKSITTILREKDPTLLRPSIATEVIVPPTPTWFEEFERIMKRVTDTKKAKPKAKAKKAPTRSRSK
jgi:hypothetical protein